MANNKVELSTGEVLIDLTSDTVTASNLLAGETAHDRSGEPITGTVNLNDYVTLSTDQNITGTKTFVGQKKILFKQSSSNDKLGFTLYNSNNVEQGYLEYNPTNKIDNYPLLTLGNYASNANGITQVGFRRYSGVSGANGAYNLLTPLIADAKTPFSLTTTYTNFYLPLGFTDGTNTVKASKSGLVDLSSIIPDTSNFVSKTGDTMSGSYIVRDTVNNTKLEFTADKLLMQKPRNSISSDPTMETVVIGGDDYKFATYVPVDGNAYIGENVSTITVLDDTGVTDEGQSEEVISDMAGFKFTKSGCTYKYADDNYTKTENLESVGKLYNGIIENGMFFPDSYMYYHPNISQSREVNFLEISNKYNDIMTETWTEDSVVCQETDDVKNTIGCYLGTTYVSRENPTQIRKLDGLKILYGHHSDYTYTEDGTIESEDTEESFYGSYLTYRSLAFKIGYSTSEDTDDDWDSATIFHYGGFNIKTSSPNCIANEENIIANRPSFVRNNSGNLPTSLNLTSFYYKNLRQYNFNYTESSNRAGKPNGLNSSFIMQNYSPEYINSSSSSNTSYNIIRKIIASSGDEWIQPISYANGTYTDGAWKRILTDSDLFTQNLGSKNIVNKYLFVQGSLTGAAGADSFATTRLRSLFIPVKASTTYTVSTGNSLLIYEIHEYTSSKVFIQYTSKNQTSATISTTSTTAYVKLLLRKSDNSDIYMSDLGNIQMNEGSNLASYTTYMPNIDEIVEYHQYADNLVPRLAQDLSFNIVANSNLNSTPYLKPGQYYCSTDANALSLTNSPTSDSFTMTVSVPTRATFEDDGTGAYVSRVREITTWKGDKYVQSCYTQGTAASYTFGSWKKIVTTADLEDLSSQVTNKASYVESVTVRKHGRTYMLNMRVSGSVPTNGWLTACNIPTSWHSTGEAVAASVAYGNAGNVNKGMSVFVGNGSVQIRMTTAMDASSNYAIITATWIS